ncbi:MAG TPA: DegT/DnrJ/EryC1/StrS family aminotransferase, partial [bacterium]|nr:DegT/DnrJ/EryC1/StrS family aminotransferase [bacterium]
VDVDPATLNLDPERLEQALTGRTRAILPVHLYGRPAAMAPIMDFARRHGLAVIEDACQAHGAELGGVRVPVSGTGCFSFYPSKNLGACGEGGCLVTDSEEVAARAAALRDHGQTEKYRHQYLGFNYRMPAFQGAVLKVKLPHLEAWTLARREHARRYLEGLAGLDLLRPEDPAGARHVFHLFVVRHPERDRLQADLSGQGIATGLHYPIPVHLQPAFAGRVRPAGPLAVTEAAARQVLSLPMYPELTVEQVDFVCAAMRAALSGHG